MFANSVGIPLPPPEVRVARADGAPLRVLVVGTIDAHKRQDLAIHALANVRDAGIAAVLSLVGGEADAEYARELRRLVADAGLEGVVRFEGSRSDVPAVMTSADVLLLPAGEVTPLVL
ncbi:MAG: glycosyltransferase, partial [Solirubrobacteraceae bacterium]